MTRPFEESPQHFPYRLLVIQDQDFFCRPLLPPARKRGQTRTGSCDLLPPIQRKNSLAEERVRKDQPDAPHRAVRTPAWCPSSAAGQEPHPFVLSTPVRDRPPPPYFSSSSCSKGRRMVNATPPPSPEKGVPCLLYPGSFPWRRRPCGDGGTPLSNIRSGISAQMTRRTETSLPVFDTDTARTSRNCRHLLRVRIP
jgi:hypothetical protein